MAFRKHHKNSYWGSQFSEFMASGLRGRTFILRNAIGKALMRVVFILGVAFLGPAVACLVVLRPFVVIRFGALNAGRIGELAIRPEIFLCKRDKRSFREKQVDVIGCAYPISNTYLKTMFGTLLPITPGAWLWRLFDKSCQFWTRTNIHHADLLSQFSDYHLILESAPHLTFAPKEVSMGQDLLYRLGIPAGSKWICLHNRDSKYLDVKLSGQWSYHDYRDFSITTMIPAAQTFTEGGYFAIRMGSVQRELLDQINPMIIDYASSPYRTEFGDIFLSAGCSAYFGSDSGIVTLPFIFRRPVSFVNYSLTLLKQVICLTSNLVLPSITKHLFDANSQRPIGLRNMFAAGLNGGADANDFAEAGISVVSNTPHEIRELADEVMHRLAGTWIPEPEDEVLQARFWRLFCELDATTDSSVLRARIGAAFLRQNQHLLD